ncbi:MULTISPECIES: hypothetical protein [Branchiibius]|nr:hypothetical protein [Branchiibius hedensis]
MTTTTRLQQHRDQISVQCSHLEGLPPHRNSVLLARECLGRTAEMTPDRLAPLLAAPDCIRLDWFDTLEGCGHTPTEAISVGPVPGAPTLAVAVAGHRRALACVLSPGMVGLAGPHVAPMFDHPLALFGGTIADNREGYLQRARTGRAAS